MMRDYQLTKQEIRNLKYDRHSFKSLKRFPVTCILFNPNSLYNVGVVIRTCEAFRIEKLIIVSENSLNFSSKKIRKTARGTQKWIDIEITDNIFEVFNKLKKDNYTIIAVELTKNSKNYSEVKYPYPVAFVFGNETKGIDNEILEKCDKSIHIDMYGMGNSLNLSVCCGIIIANAIEKFFG